MTKSLPKSIVFITGAFLGNNCWDDWKAYFESQGYRCLAPAWPYKDASPEELRNRHPGTDIASNRLVTLTDYYADIVTDLPMKPILIGHSLGGLMVQLLLQRELGRAGVAIHSFPPQSAGRLSFSFLQVTWEAMGFFSSARKAYMIPFKKWKQTLANGIDCKLQKQWYYQYAVPESKRLIRDIFNHRTKINFKKPHAPLLFTSGTRDKIIPAPLNYSNYKKYKSSNSITDYKEFKGHNHLVFGQPIWEAEADFIAYWLEGINS